MLSFNSLSTSLEFFLANKDTENTLLTDHSATTLRHIQAMVEFDDYSDDDGFCSDPISLNCLAPTSNFFEFHLQNKGFLFTISGWH